MSLQHIIDNSDGLEINRRRVVGIQYARNQLVKTNETPTVNPWQIEVNPGPIPFNKSRAIIEELDRLDRNKPETVTLGNHANMKWLYKYQGQCTAAELESLGLASFAGNQMVVSVVGVAGPSKIVFAKGDLIQLRGFPHPFTVTNDVVRGTETTVTITTHRPNVLLQTVPIGTKFNVGSDCEFRVICTNMPTYGLKVGAYSSKGGVVENNGYIEFSGSFELYEYII